MRRTVIDPNKKYGRLTPIQEVFGANRVKDRPSWECLCDCGNKTVVRSSHLSSGNNKSCGCLVEEIKQAIVKNGSQNPTYTHGKTNSITYQSWIRMKTRCLNPNSPRYSQYSKLGIEPKWVDSFEEFLKDMGERPSVKHSIDRIDNTKGYYPGNCRWATQKEQANNTSTNILLTLNNTTKTVKEWSEELNIPYKRLIQRVHSESFPVEKITSPQIERNNYIANRQLFSREQVQDIKDLTKTNSITSIAKKYGVTWGTINNIVKGRTYKNYPACPHT